MKKLISLLAALAVVSACSFGALAADITVDYENPEVTNGTITATEAAELQNHVWDTADAEKTYTFEVSDPSYQNTILAFDGTDTIKVGTIQYIDQGTADFTFALRNNASTAEKITVLMGGKDAPVIAGYIAKEQSSTPETFTVTGSVTATIGKTLPVVKIVDTTDSAKEYTATVLNDGTYTIESVPAGSYTYTITKAAHITYTSPLTISADKDIANITIYAGDTNADGGINVSDFTAIGNNFGTSLDEAGVAFVKAADTNDDDGINVSDFTAIGNNFGKSADTNYTAIQ